MVSHAVGIALVVMGIAAVDVGDGKGWVQFDKRVKEATASSYSVAAASELPSS